MEILYNYFVKVCSLIRLFKKNGRENVLHVLQRLLINNTSNNAKLIYVRFVYHRVNFA